MVVRLVRAQVSSGQLLPNTGILSYGGESPSAGGPWPSGADRPRNQKMSDAS